MLDNSHGGVTMLIISTVLTEGDEDRLFLEGLYVRYQRQMIHVARSLLASSEDAEDCVQEVFLHLVRKGLPRLRQLANEEDLRNYLLKAAKNAALTQLRRNRHDKQFREEAERAESARVSELSNEDFLETICRHTEYEACLHAIQALPPVYRDVLYQRFVLDLTIPEIAALQGKKRETVKKQVVRGKKLLLKKLRRNCPESFSNGETVQ